MTRIELFALTECVAVTSAGLLATYGVTRDARRLGWMLLGINAATILSAIMEVL